jgi:hypothetical protein
MQVLRDHPPLGPDPDLALAPLVVVVPGPLVTQLVLDLPVALVGWGLVVAVAAWGPLA